MGDFETLSPESDQTRFQPSSLSRNRASRPNTAFKVSKFESVLVDIAAGGCRMCSI